MRMSKVYVSAVSWPNKLKTQLGAKTVMGPLETCKNPCESRRMVT